MEKMNEQNISRVNRTDFAVELFDKVASLIETEFDKIGVKLELGVDAGLSRTFDDINELCLKHIPRQHYDIVVMDYYMSQVRVFRNVECSDPEEWLEENDPHYDSRICYYMADNRLDYIDVQEMNKEVSCAD